MSKRGSNSEPFAHENDALTAKPQLHLGLRVSKGRRFKQTELMSPPWLQVGPYIYKHENFRFVSSYLSLRRF